MADLLAQHSAVVAELPKLLADALQKNKPSGLIDPSGFGKPLAFSGKEQDWQRFASKFEAHVEAAYPGARRFFEWAVEQNSHIGREDATGEFDGSGTSDEIVGISRLLAGVQTSLLHLTDTESNDIVINARHAAESWRRLEEV